MVRTEGWNWLFSSRKWHYFTADGRSLCKRFMIFGPNTGAEQGGDASPDNCKECSRRRHRIIVSGESKAGTAVAADSAEGSVATRNVTAK